MKVIQPETKLYPLVLAWLNSRFRVSGALPELTERSEIFASDISQVPSEEGGLWSRPDLAALVFTRGKYVPYWTFSLCSFEIKTAKGMNTSAIYEAFAHTRFAHYSILFWQSKQDDAKLVEWLNLCSQFGLGAITAEEPNQPSSYVLHLQPKRTSVDNSTIDAFIGDRFNNEKKRRISGWLKAQGWARDSDIEETI